MPALSAGREERPQPRSLCE